MLVETGCCIFYVIQKMFLVFLIHDLIRIGANNGPHATRRLVRGSSFLSCVGFGLSGEKTSRKQAPEQGDTAEHT